MNNSCDHKSESFYEDANSKLDPKFFEENSSENENMKNNSILNKQTMNQNKSQFRLKHTIKQKIEIPKSNSTNGRGANYPLTPPISYHNKEVDKGCCKDNLYCVIF